jgi:hypothetical protein
MKIPSVSATVRKHPLLAVAAAVALGVVAAVKYVNR